MILIADGGSTKVDWIALSTSKQEKFRVQTEGLNPEVVPIEVLEERMLGASVLEEYKEEVSQVFFYGAGCGTEEATNILKTLFQKIFKNAEVVVKEDLWAAVYASTGNDPAIVCILGTGSNSCYYNGENLEVNSVSLGYTVMDEASGNYFGKELLRDYFYKRMPEAIAKDFEATYDLNADVVKYNLYRQPNPNTYLATFAKFMFTHRENAYTKEMIENGFDTFFKWRVVSYGKEKEVPIYFIGSIAYYFSEILDKVAESHQMKITKIVRRPIDNLLEYHKNI